MIEVFPKQLEDLILSYRSFRTRIWSVLVVPSAGDGPQN